MPQNPTVIQVSQYPTLSALRALQLYKPIFLILVDLMICSERSVLAGHYRSLRLQITSIFLFYISDCLDVPYLYRPVPSTSLCFDKPLHSTTP